MNRKKSVFFGPPLALLAGEDANTMTLSGKLNRTAERYLEILGSHGLVLEPAEQECLIDACGVGHLSPQDMRELADEVRFSDYAAPHLDKEALARKLESASFADLVATVEALGF